MREIMKKTIILVLTLIMVLGMSVTSAWAETKWSAATTYTTTDSFIEKDETFNLTVVLTTTGTTSSAESVSFESTGSGFTCGSVNVAHNTTSPQNITVTFNSLKYAGGDNKNLNFTVGGETLTIEVKKECYTPVEANIKKAQDAADKAQQAATDAKGSADKAEGYAQQSESPITYAMPKAIISRNDLPAIKAGDEFSVTVNVKNKNNNYLVMSNPIATVELSSDIMLMDNQNVYELPNISAGKTASFVVKCKALKKITSANQTLTANIEFDYRGSSASYSTDKGTATGTVTIPCTPTEEEETELVDGPVPNLIVKNFDYGGSSVAAGSEFTFGLKFMNTNEKVACENVIVTVDSVGFTPNGASNSFYFNKVAAASTKTIYLPMKASSTFAESTEPITISFSYEYVENKKRTTMQSSSKVSVPVYQKDRFEIQNPVVPGICYEGEEISVTMSYVNKGKASANNVATEITGDVSSPMMTQNLGNIASGSNGQFAFAITPNSVGECNFQIKVTYEDADENLKERVFPVTLNVEAMTWEDPGIYEEPVEEPVKSHKWIYFVVGGLVLVIGTIIAVKKIKKKKAKKVDDSQWKAWEEEFAKEDQKAQENSENK